MKNFKNELWQSAKVLVVALFLSLGVSYAFAATWTGPTAPPPGANTLAPLNVGALWQSRLGSLGIGMTTQPTQTLDVVGNIKIESPSGGATSNGLIMGSGKSDNLPSFDWYGTSPSGATDTCDGIVGANINTPGVYVCPTSAVKTCTDVAYGTYTPPGSTTQQSGWFTRTDTCVSPDEPLYTIKNDTGSIKFNNNEGVTTFSTDQAGNVCLGTDCRNHWPVLSPGVKTITTSGTWTKPDGVTTVFVSCVGGGGSGDNIPASWGGLAGDPGKVMTASIVFPSPAQNVSVTIGAAGFDGNPGWSYGISGGATTFGSSVTAPGGAGTDVSAVCTTDPNTGATSCSGGIPIGTYTSSDFPYGGYGQGGAGQGGSNGMGSYGSSAGACYVSYQYLG